MNEDMEKMLQEAPAPTLTLEPFAEEKEEPAVVEKEEAVQPVDEKEKIKAILTPQEQKQVDAFVKQIDITNSQMVLQYGASSQKKIADHGVELVFECAGSTFTANQAVQIVARGGKIMMVGTG